MEEEYANINNYFYDNFDKNNTTLININDELYVSLQKRLKSLDINNIEIFNYKKDFITTKLILRKNWFNSIINKFRKIKLNK